MGAQVITAQGQQKGALLGGWRELSFTQVTSDVVISGSTEGAATTIVTATAFTADGTSTYLVEVFLAGRTGTNQFNPVLYEGSGSVGILSPGLTSGSGTLFAQRELVPAAGSRTYSLRAYTDNPSATTAKAGAGGSGAYVPGFIRISQKV